MDSQLNKMSVDDHLLLHPELLSDEQLRSVIRERHLKLPSLENMSREDMLQIFHQYCVPYAQRQYRDSGRGKILNKSRESSGHSPSKPQHSYSYNTPHASTRNSRLQTSPDMLTKDVKRMKLNNSLKITSHIELSVKRKVQFHMERSCASNGIPPEKKARKPITWP